MHVVGEGVTATQPPTRTPRWVWPVVAALLLAQAVVLALWPAAHLLMIDLQVYRAGGEHLLAGTPLYDGGMLLDLPFVYPPFAAIVFVPLTVLPLPVLKFGWTVVGVALVVFVVRRSAALVGVRAGAAVTALLVVVLLALDPITRPSTSARSTSSCSRWCSPTSPGGRRGGAGSGWGSRPR